MLSVPIGLFAGLSLLFGRGFEGTGKQFLKTGGMYIVQEGMIGDC